MMGNDLSGSHSRALDVGVQLFRLEDPVVGVESVLAT